MTGLTAEQKADLARLSSDLLFVLQDSGVALPFQAPVGTPGHYFSAALRGAR